MLHAVGALQERQLQLKFTEQKSRGLMQEEGAVTFIKSTSSSVTQVGTKLKPFALYYYTMTDKLHTFCFE